MKENIDQVIDKEIITSVFLFPSSFIMASSNTREFEMFEAHMFLNSMSLRSMIFQDYLIVMRSDFDVMLSEEPFIARTVYYNMTTGKYMARLWDRTVTSGRATSLQQFTDACKNHFSKGRLCLGYPAAMSEPDKILVSQTPITRKLSRSCQGYVGELDGPNVTVCSECTRDVGLDLKELNDHNEYCKTDVESTKVASGNEIVWKKHVNYLSDGQKEALESVKKKPRIVPYGHDINDKELRCHHCKYTTKVKNNFILHNKAQHGMVVVPLHGVVIADKDQDENHAVVTTREKSSDQTHCDVSEIDFELEPSEAKTQTVVIHTYDNSTSKPSEAKGTDDSSEILQWDMVLQKNITKIVPAAHKPKPTKPTPTKPAPTKPTKCEDCEKEFASEQGLLAHRKTEHLVGPFNCLKCSFKVGVYLVNCIGYDQG